MKKTLVPIMLIFCLLFPLTALSTAEAESGSYIEFTVNTPAENKTYSKDHLTLNVSVQWLWANLYGVSYSIDNQNRRYLPMELNFKDLQTFFSGSYQGVDTIPKLSDGEHNVTVYIECQSGSSPTRKTRETIVYFTVDTKSPSLSDITIQDQICNQPVIPLNFTINEATSWVGYSLDNTANVTITGNATITPAAGAHNVVIYANDTAGNMAKTNTFNFTIQTNPPAEITLIIIGAVSLVTAGTFLIVFLYRRHLGLIVRST